MTMGQWKLCRTANLDWNKSTLVWPVDAAGMINTELRWPLNGCISANAPARNAVSNPNDDARSQNPSISFKVRVRRNGIDTASLLTRISTDSFLFQVKLIR